MATRIFRIIVGQRDFATKSPLPRKGGPGVNKLWSIDARVHIPVNFRVRNPRPPKVAPPVCRRLPIVITGARQGCPAGPAATPCPAAGVMPPGPRPRRGRGFGMGDSF